MFIEGSHRNVFRRNVVAGSDVAVVLYDPDGGHRFEGNSFVGNLTPLDLVGRHTDTAFAGNYWSDNDEPDLDGDGRSDSPVPPVNVFDHFRGNLTAADLLADSLAASGARRGGASLPGAAAGAGRGRRARWRGRPRCRTCPGRRRARRAATRAGSRVSALALGGPRGAARAGAAGERRR